MTVARLSVVDDIFYRGHHGRGAELMMQGVWRFDERVDPTDLAGLHDWLAVGPLNRRVVSSRVPWARRAFVGDAPVAPIRVEPEPIPADGVVAWADAQAATDIDVDSGPCWELALAHVVDAGSVATLTCSHLVTDGLGLTGLARAALGDSTDGPGSATRPRLRDDIVDAVALWIRVVLGVMGSLARACVDRDVRDDLLAAARASGHTAPPPGDRPTTETRTVVSFDAAHWDRRMADTHATATATTVDLVADIVRELRGPGPVEIAIPMTDHRSTGPGSLTVAELVVDDEDPQACADALRRAYARAGAGAGLGPPGGMPAELLQLLGDRIAHALLPDPGGREALVSPLGDLGPMFDELAGHPSSGLAVRAVTPTPDLAATAASAGLIRAWTSRGSGRVTLALVARADIDRRRLDEIVIEVGARRGLTALPW